MESFAPQDVRQYYTGSFFLHPDTGEVLQVADVSREVGNITPYTMDGKTAPLIDKNRVTWEHVKIPQLGYRCLENKYLYYVCKKVGRITTKGVNQSTISVEDNTTLTGVLRQLSEKDWDAYVRSARVQRGPLMKQIFKPEFTPFEEAVAELAAGKAVAFALNHDFAVALGKRADRALTLYWKGWQPVAYSEDGKTWRLVHEAYRDSIKRGIGELNYAT